MGGSMTEQYDEKVSKSSSMSNFPTSPCLPKQRQTVQPGAGSPSTAVSTNESTLTYGSHHIYVHADVPELVNLQNVNGQAKPYQVKQLLRLIERYNLQMEEEL
jgi:hypothetical protein